MTIKQVDHKGILCPTSKQQYKDLRCNLYYDSDRKRYWASITPCTISDWGMECELFNNKSEVILTVANRRSKKTDEQAIALFDASMPRYKGMFATVEQKLAQAEVPVPVPQEAPPQQAELF